MGIVSWLSAWRFAQRREALVTEAARKCRPWLRARVEDLAIEMRPTEGRGYIRGHATPFVLAELQAAIADLNDWAADAQTAIINDTVDAAVGLVYQDMFGARPRRLTVRRAA